MVLKRFHLQKVFSTIVLSILVIFTIISCCAKPKRGPRGPAGPSNIASASCLNTKITCKYTFAPIVNNLASAENCVTIQEGLTRAYVFGCNDPDTPNCAQKSPTITSNMQVINDSLNDPIVCPTVSYPTWSTTEPYLNSNYFWEFEADQMIIYFALPSNPGTVFVCDPNISPFCIIPKSTIQNGVVTQTQGANIGKQYFLTQGFLMNSYFPFGNFPFRVCIEYSVELSATPLSCN